jgi:glycosyltransferase involved in cell wall biosynthesis
LRPSIRLSVVIPCLNAAATLGVQLEALARQSWSEPWEVVVADNGSRDTTIDVATGYRDRIPALRIVDASERPGVAFGRNRGTAEAVGELIAFCDADDEVAPGWLSAIGDALGRHDFVAARPEHAKLNPRWVFESWEPPPEDGLRAHRFPPYLKYARGGCLGVRRSVHEAVGGFDESMSSCEDDDYCFRVQLAGHPLTPAPDAVVHVRLRARTRDLFTQARWYAEGEAQLQRKFRSAGRPPQLWRWPLLHWGGIARSLPRIGSRSGRARLVWLLGFQLGRYLGSLRYRVLAV